MSAKIKKSKLSAIETNDHLHATVDEIARIEVVIRQRCAKRDAAIQLVRIEHDTQIEEDKSRRDALMKLAATYASVNRASLFATGFKSAASALAIFGFRKGNPTIKTLNSKWTLDKVLAGLRELGKYIRTVEEIDKQAIHDAGLTDAQLAEIGIRIDSGERFYVESKSEEADRLNAQPEEAAAG